MVMTASAERNKNLDCTILFFKLFMDISELVSSVTFTSSKKIAAAKETARRNHSMLISWSDFSLLEMQ
jgi:hypothetical protein